MYKFITVEGKCGQPYNLAECEGHANRMHEQGYELVQVYQTTMAACGGGKSVLVIVFRKTDAA